MNELTDVVELRDGEVERLLQENARLNARVVSLLKILEHMQAHHAESVVEQTDTDREAIPRAVRTALETELSPILLLVLRLLERQRANPGAVDRDSSRAGSASASGSGPSGWLVDLLGAVEDQTTADRRSRFGELMGQMRGPRAVTPRRRYAPHEDPT